MLKYMHDALEAKKDMTALMAAVLLKDWEGLLHLIGGLSEKESKAVIVSLTGLLGQLVFNFAAHSDVDPLEFWLEAMEGTHSEE